MDALLEDMKPSTKILILQALAEGGGKILSSASLSQSTGLSRQGVWKAIVSLRKEGIPIESFPQKGYRLMGKPTYDLAPTWLEWNLSDCPLGHPLHLYERVPSTQEIVKASARSGANQGLVAVCEEQTEGRGRRGRQWTSPRRLGLYFSTLLRPPLPPQALQLVSFAAGIAVLSALEELFSLHSVLKWPNDVLIRNRKVCGILSEAAGETDRVHYVVTGIGLNANFLAESFPQDLAGRATSLLIELGHPVDRGTVLVTILRHLATLMALLCKEGQGQKELLALYREKCGTVGQWVRVVTEEKEFLGKAIGISDEGSLLVDSNGNIKIFSVADVFHLDFGDGS